MRKTQKILAVILCLAMALTLCPLAFAADDAAVTVLYTNDIHTYIDGDLTYSKLAALKDSYEDVLLVDAGDHIQGTAYGSMDKGKTIIELMNAAGYDAATLGNHEFDYGMDGRIKVTDEWAKFPYLSCNFYHEVDGEPHESVLPAYQIFEKGGLKIAFIGITTPESFTKSTPAYFQDADGNYIYGIAGGEDGKALYAAVQTAIDSAAAKADVVIALAHLGDDPASKPWTSEEVIANTTGLDAFIDGHSHSTVEGKAVKDAAGNEVWLTQTGEYLGAIGEMSITADGKIDTKLLDIESVSLEPKAEVKAIEDAWITEIDTKLGEVIGSIDDTLDNYDAEGKRLVRSQETNTGDFAADALYYLFDNMGLDVDVAIMNGGGVRNKAITGEISYKTCKEIHTFGNVACLQTITGQQLLDALEWGARGTTDEEIGGFLQVAGIKYTIDTSVPSTVQMDDKGVWTGGPTGLYRVRDVLIEQDGEYVPLDLKAEYNLAGYNYTLRDLGDGFAMFDGAVNVLDYVMEDYMVLANYVKSFKDGKVTGYAEPAGRITLLKDEAAVTIFHTNDIHTYIDGELTYSKLAALKDSYENVLLVDAGDHIQGTAYGSMDKGETIIKLMNAAGYDAATLGNHEFDYGMEGRIKVTDEWAEFPYLSANFYHEKDGVAGESVLDAYKVFEVGGKKVAFIGITTPESFTKSTPAYFQDADGNYIYGIAGGEDGKALYEAVQKAIDAASAEADYVIALAHLGDDKASQPWTSEEVIANTKGLDAFIDGHSHTTNPGKAVKDAAGSEVWLVQTGEYLGAIGKLSITADGKFVSELLGPGSIYVTPDKDVKAIEDAWVTEIDTKLGEVIGSIDDTLDNYDEAGNRLVRKQETNTGDFAADALYYLFDNMGLDVDLAIMNGGGIRNKAITGEISYKTCKEIHTFGNVACLQTVTGQQILDALEWGARQTPDVEVGGFLHVAGIKYTVDASVTSTVQADDKGVWTGAPTGEYRVKDVQILQDGKYVDLDLKAEYNLAGYNYTLRDLGDGFAMFDGAVNVLDYVMEDYMVLANYVESFKDGKVTGYAEPQGRITIINAGGEDEELGKVTIGGLTNNVWMTKYGNVYCDAKAELFAKEFAWGDIVTVKFLDQELNLPVIPTYSYVDSGKPAVIMEKTDKGLPTGYISFAINMGNFADVYGIATKGTDADGNWFWTAKEGVTFPIEISFEMYEKEGYMAEYILRDLTRTNVREDYADLTDEEFANFRHVEGNLYRSSSPINPELGRNTYADAAIKAAGVDTIVNLADTLEEATGYEGYEDTYYSEQGILYLGLGVDFAEQSFKDGLASGLKYIAANEGTYLIHCTEGKDRAGFVNAVLECLMGWTYEEVVADYMVTYYNYYGIEPGTDKYTAIANSNIIKSLAAAFEVEDLAKADLAAGARAYIKSIGLTDAQIDALLANLTGEKAGFTDVAEGAWYAGAVEYVVEAGYMNGVSATEFAPKATMTRAMLATILYRMAGEPAVETAAGFEDVAEGKWYSEAIAWAAAEGIVNGYSDKYFGTNDAVTREQLATMIYRYVDYLGLVFHDGVALDEFNDADEVSAWAVDALKWAVAAGIVTGTPEGDLNPQGTATRAEAAVMFERM